MPSYAGEGGGGLHFICTPTQPHHTTQPPSDLLLCPCPPIPTHTSLTHFVNGVSSCFTHTAPLLLGPKASHPLHPPTFTPTHLSPPHLPMLTPTPPHPHLCVRGAFILGFHLHTPHTSLPHFVNVCYLHCTSLLHGPKAPHPQPHPPMLTSTPSTLLVVQYWCSGSQRAILGSE